MILPEGVHLTGPSDEPVPVETAIAKLINDAMVNGDGDPEEALQAFFEHELSEHVAKQFPSWRGWGIEYPEAP